MRSENPLKETWHAWHVEAWRDIVEYGKARTEADAWRLAQRIATAVLTDDPRAEVHLYVGTEVIALKPGNLWETDEARRIEALAVLRSTCAARIGACY